MTLTHGGLFEGYGGTTMAVAMALGELDTRWVSDIKPASIALLRHHNPDMPNLGDMTVIDWAGVEPVDVLTASWPCQPHSSAGKRLGEADPRALWPHVARAIGHLRPAIFLGENVARITSNGELRRVVRSLADLGYVGAWRVQRASDPPVYGCHQRARCFVVAIDAAVDPATYTGGVQLRNEPGRRGRTRGEGAGVAGHDGAARSDRLTLLPTPTQSMTTGAGTSGREGGLNLQTAVTLIPTPRESDAGPRGGTTGFGLRNWSREIALMPTPKASDGYKGGPNMRGSSGDLAMPSVAVQCQTSWGPYAEAIARWGANFDREAPAPTQLGPRGGFQLSPRFVEWMMGLPEGWVCDVPDLAPRANGHRNAALSLLGDGVMPQQGAAAFTFLLDHLAQRWAVAA